MASRRLAFFAIAALLAGVCWLRNLLSLSWQLPMARRDRPPASLPPTRKHLELERAYGLDAGTFTSTKTFPLLGGSTDQGIHYRLLNAGVLTQTEALEQNALLVIVVFTDRESWGPGRSVHSLFAMLQNSSYPTQRISVTLLTSNQDEFRDVRDRLYDYVSAFAQFSLIFRNDFKPTDDSRAAKLSAHARYRNFAVLSTIEPWHQHVVWMDPDVYDMPRDLLTKMVAADRDIVVPMCAVSRENKPILYDTKSWSRSLESQKAVSLIEFRQGQEELVTLDSVGGTMLYVKADVHRQGVVFPYQRAVDNKGKIQSSTVLHHDNGDGVGVVGLETRGAARVAHRAPRAHLIHQLQWDAVTKRPKTTSRTCSPRSATLHPINYSCATRLTECGDRQAVGDDVAGADCADLATRPWDTTVPNTRSDG